MYSPKRRFRLFRDPAFATPTFKPTDITGCQLWLDAADESTVTLTNSLITNVADKSTFRRNPTAAANGFSYTQGATRGFNGASRAAGSHLGRFEFTLNQPATIFTVAQLNDSGAGYICDGLTDGNRIALIGLATSNPSMFAGTVLGSTNFLFNTRAVYTARFNTATSILQRNSNVIGSGDVGTNNAGGLVIGARLNNIDQFQGDINEVCVYSGALSSFDIQKVEGYLAWKWGLQGNLPPEHPFKNAPPTA